MPAAARITDTTTHGGTVTGPGSTTVIIGGLGAALGGDNHVCSIPANTGHLQASVFPVGSTSVFIDGAPALRAGDVCACGASVAVGEPRVIIG